MLVGIILRDLAHDVEVLLVPQNVVELLFGVGHVDLLRVALEVLREQAPSAQLAEVTVADLRAGLVRRLGRYLLLTLPLAKLLLSEKPHKSVVLHFEVFVKQLALVFDVVLGHVEAQGRDLGHLVVLHFDAVLQSALSNCVV